VTGACAIHCRYCFRRNFPYAEQQLSAQKWQVALNFLHQHTDISELILSGGDPLLFNDQKLAELLEHLQDIPHLQRIRIHSRVPIVLPERITPTLLEVLGSVTKPLVLVLHANHANELRPAVTTACTQLKQLGVTLLNQSVLLKGVNDNSPALIHLSEKLFQSDILPYYLHQLDHAKGTGHFAVPKQQALQLLEILRKQLPGYLVPKLVTEQAGAAYKIPLG
jgi:EF-P beta-lysylation protein EpmB